MFIDAPAARQVVLQGMIADNICDSCKIDPSAAKLQSAVAIWLSAVGLWRMQIMQLP